VIDLMFAAALSGMRTSEATGNPSPEALDFNLDSVARRTEAVPSEWTAPSQYFHLRDEQDCPIFFEIDLLGFGSVRLTPLCAAGRED
jgi:hypothetical protein